MRKRFANIGKPCPGPQWGKHLHSPCPDQSVVSPEQGALAQRCRVCSYRRQAEKAVQQQRVYRAKQRAEGKIPPSKTYTGRLDGGAKTIPCLPWETRRAPIKRCKTCMGDAHMREQGRLDDYGVPVCLPGMARCWRCWEPWAPLPEVHAVAVLGSSAAQAVRSSTW